MVLHHHAPQAERNIDGEDNREQEQEAWSTQDPDLISPARIHGVLEICATLSTLGFFSFFGLLARLGLIAIGTYDGRTVFPVLWAQILGCLFMGVFTARKDLIEAIYLPLYVGLTTGFCANVTTFSSWMAGVFQAFAQIGTSPHGGFYNFMDGLGQSIFTLAASVSIFIFGTQIGPVLLHSRLMEGVAKGVRFAGGSTGPNGYGMEKQHNQAKLAHHPVGNGHTQSSASSPPKPCQTSRTSSPRHPPSVQLGVCAVFIGLWIGAILVTCFEPQWRGTVGFSLIFSPPATWLRFYLSKLNPKHPKFPLGTFLANQLGTAILAGSLALQYTSGRSLLQCQVLQGIDDGFCGCLTTVSTFILEVRKLERRHGYFYVVASWLAGQALMLLILGSVDFSRGGLNAAKCAVR